MTSYNLYDIVVQIPCLRITQIIYPLPTRIIFSLFLPDITTPMNSTNYTNYQLLVYCFIIFSFQCLSQNIERQAFLSAGDDFSNGTASLSISIGESITETFLSANTHLSQGFQQGIFVALPLPIELNLFQATRQNSEKVKLHWEVTQEVELAGFWIERKLENKTDFEPIKYLRAYENNNSSQSYFWLDDNDYWEQSYYRLKILKQDGEFFYSEIRSVKGSPLNNFFNISPNPTSDNLTVSIKPDSRIGFENIEIIILDTSGKTLITRSYPSDNQLITIQDFKNFPSGIYWLVLKTDVANPSYFKVVKTE